MLKRDKIIQSLIANGYNEELVNELPKAFIEDYFEKDKETLSEALDIFIDIVQSGDVSPNEFGCVYFGSITKMSGRDFKPDDYKGLFYNFKSHIKEEYLTIVKRRPLRNILVNAGILELDEDYCKYNEEIIGSKENWHDLCKITCTFYCPKEHEYRYNTIYIRLNDLLKLLATKGISNDNKRFQIVVGNNHPEYLIEENNSDLFINYDAIMSLGNTQAETEELVPKKKPEKN